MGIRLSQVRLPLPPPLVDPIAHPWISRIGNKLGMTAVQATTAAIAFPVASSLIISGDDRKAKWSNLGAAALTGAIIGGAVGTFLPLTACRTVNRWGSIRTGVIDGMWGGPVAASAFALASQIIGWHPIAPATAATTGAAGGAREVQGADAKK